MDYYKNQRTLNIKLFQMSYNQGNNFNLSQSMNGRSAFVRFNFGSDLLSINKLIEQCNKYSITIIQLPDQRLQSGLNLLPLKAKAKNSSQKIVLFVTKFTENPLVVTAYFHGKKIDKANLNNEEQMAKAINQWLSSIKSSTQDYRSASIKMIEELNKKCTEIAKQYKNEMIAIQKIKSTIQYQSLIEHQIQLCMQIDSLSQSLIMAEKQLERQNSEVLSRIISIEALKNQIQQHQYQYEDVCKCFRSVKEQINQLIEKQKTKVQSMQIKSENQLADFLAEAKKLKKLELQKKFLV